MLSPETLRAIAAFECPACQRPLGRFHAYPVLDPATLLSGLTEHAPMHLECARNHTEDTLHEGRADTLVRLSVITVIKAAPRSPSAKLIRLHPEDPSTIFLRLFSPDQVQFYHVTPHDHSMIVRPAEYTEIQQWLEPALAAAMNAAGGNAEELAELTQTIARLHKFLPKRPSAQ